MIELKIRFTKRIYGSEDSNFSVYAAVPATRKDSYLVRENKYGNISISGDFFLDGNELDNVYTVTIQEDFNSKYPSSYKLIKIHYELPKSAKDQWEYLFNSGVVPMGTYFEIEKVFNRKDKILDIIIDNPSRLTKVKGIGDRRAEIYQERIVKHKDRAAIFAEYGHIDGVGHSIIKMLVAFKPDVRDTIKAIKKDPFCLLDNKNVGFVVADRFRAHYGLPLNDKNRILHGVSYYLEKKFNDTGNTYEDVYNAARYASEKLLVDYEEVLLLLSDTNRDGNKLEKYRLKIFGSNITTFNLFNAESSIYQGINSMMKKKKSMISKNKWLSNKEEYLSKLDSKLSDEQSQFLDMINEERVSVLLGPGGSGKSWLTSIACDLIKQAKLTYGLFAPTARAAHVMSDYTGSPAQTIHKGLMSHALMNNIAPYDVLIVDEFSMVDSELASIVMQTIGVNTRLIIIGDDFQLQSVGPGNVLFDIVNYIKAPTIKLTKIFRQKEGNKILDYADDLRNGTFRIPATSKIEYPDITIINEIDDRRQRDLAMSFYKKAIDNNVEDIMLLTPVNKGFSGRRNLNKEVQSIVNPPTSRDEIVFGANLGSEDDKRYFRIGDYITVKKNHYDITDDEDNITEIINGDLGTVDHVYNNKLTFSIDNHSYTIDKAEINDMIDHAWALTVHKSQGGQADTVIIVLPRNSAFMLNANMLYTAITRAKIECYIIGDINSINSAAREQVNLIRKTMIQLQSSKSGE